MARNMKAYSIDVEVGNEQSEYSLGMLYCRDNYFEIY